MRLGDRVDDEGSENVPEQSSTSAGSLSSSDQGRSGIFDNGFEAYRTVTDDDYRSLFKSGLIVLDANVFLDLYRYHPETRQELLDVLNRLREHLWIPNQVMGEFWARRESVLEDASDITGTVGDLNKFGEQYVSRVRQWTNSAGLRQQTADELVQIAQSAFGVTAERIRSLADDKTLRTAQDTAKDSVVTRLDSILKGRVGNPLSPERKRDAVNREAPQRFADKRPPGYMDANKKNDNSVGDYLIWIEMLEEATRLKVDVLFVTGDTKEDWWRQERGQAKGPHPQLVEEMRNVAGVRLFMLRPASFLKHAGDLLQIKVSPESLQDAQRVTARAESRFFAASLVWEVAQKLRAVFGEQVVSLPGTSETYKGQPSPDVVVRLPDRMPVAFEVKYATRPGNVKLRIRDGLVVANQMADAINGRGMLIIILSDEFAPEDVGKWRRTAENYAKTLISPPSIYVARYSDFEAEPAENFAGIVMPADTSFL